MGSSFLLEPSLLLLPLLSKAMHTKHPKTKSSKKWIAFPIIFLVWICCYLVINARKLIFTNISDTNSELKWRFSGIHFTSLWNDFGWGVFWELGSSDSEQTTIRLENGWDQKCGNFQAKWLYYNDARWARLWPLDQQTLEKLRQSDPSYDDLTMSGWLYKDCDQNKNMVIHGVIEYTLGGVTSWLIGWVKLDYDTNQYKSEFAENLQMFDNNTPLGYIWDSYGGIGFIGGKLDWTWCSALLTYLNTWSIQQSFHLDTNWFIQLNTSFLDNCERTPANGKATDIWNLLIQWSTILSTTVSSWEKTALLGALQEKTVLLSSSDINSAAVMNAAKKNAGSLCRGKTLLGNNNGHSINDDAGETDVLCYENAPNLTLDLNDWNYEGKTIIINSGNVTLTNSMTGDTPAIDIFVNAWNIYLEPLQALQFTTFNSEWFPSETDVKNQGRFLKGNFVINGLLLWWNPWNITWITNKLHLYGKFVSLNTPLTLSSGRKEQVNDILGSSNYDDRIPFKRTLTWFCGYNGSWSDWSPSCGWWTWSVTAIPFVILDWNFSSRIIK